MAEIRLCAFSDEAASDVLGQIKALKENGVYLTELRSANGKNVSEFTKAENKEYYKMFRDNGIGVFSIGSPLGKVDIDTDFEKYLDVVKRVCETANDFKAEKIRVFSFFNAYDKKNKVFDYLNKMVEVSNEYNVTLCHENEKEIFGDIADRVCMLMNEIKGLKFVYDPANYIQVNEPAQKTLDLCHAKSEYFHIKDVIASTGEVVSAGYGDGDVDSLVKRIDSDKVLTLEPHLAIFDAYAKIDNTEMKHKFHFESNLDAFATAVNAIKDILANNGYVLKGDKYVK